MSSGVSCPASPFPTATVSSPLCKSLNSFTYFSTNLVIPRTLCSSEPKLKGIRCTGGRDSRNNRVRCNSSIRPGGPGSDNNESRSVLNAFFLGKALAEAINERVESTVGEVLSAIGRLQAEQQKQVQDFQEDVLERAKQAKEKAAREAIEAQRSTAKSAVNTAAVGDTASSETSRSTKNVVTPVSPPSVSIVTTQAVETDSE